VRGARYYWPELSTGDVMKLVKTEDAELRCEHTVRPGAPALLMLNSLGTSLEMWDDQFEALSERYELIRFDARGHGKSTLGSHEELTMEQLARDAVAVLDACGVARAHLCGLSIGGMVAMQIATLWPDRVLKIALASTAPTMPPRDMWQTRIDAVRAHGMAPLIDAILGRWFTLEFRTTQPEAVQRIRMMLLETDPRGYAALATAIRDMDQRESIRAITAKTLVMGGTRDPSTTPKDAELIASSIPDARLVMLEGQHMVNIERAAEFTATVLEFLAA
jgi:3-oxoadipate enol-lactonase